MTSGRPDWYDQVVITGSDVTLPIGIVSSSVTLDVSITSSTTINVAITSSSVTLDVNVTGTANVNIESASVYLNVKNEGFIETRYLFENKGATASWIADTKYRCKFFGNNARGLISAIQLYAKNDTTTDETIEIRLAITPTGPAVHTYSLTIPANSAEGWYTVYPYLWWDYSTLAVQFHPQGNASLAYDTGTPYDDYDSDTSYETMHPRAHRWWMKVWLNGQPSGAVPVAGTLNTINIPNKSTGSSTANITINPNTEVSLMTIEGTGKIKYIRLYTNYHNMYFKFYADGDLISWSGGDYTCTPYLLDYHEQTRRSLRATCLRYDTTNNVFYIEWNVEMAFKKSFEIRAENLDAANSHIASVGYCIYEKIT